MAERNYNPSSTACGRWEILLADSLDGVLKPADEAEFAAHLVACQACETLFDEARRGREWIEFLSPEPEVPVGLLDKILARTGPGHEVGFGTAAFVPQISNTIPGSPIPFPARQYPGFMGQVRRFAEPRLLMTAAMAFFSIALTINLTGVRVSELRMADLRTDVVLSMPSTARSFVERRLNMASTPIIRYYDNSRFAYEVQNGIKQLRRTTGGDVQGEGEQNRRKPLELNPGESKQTPKQNNGAPTETLQQSASPTVEPTLNNSDFLETSLRFQHCPAHSGGSSSVMLGVEIRERSTVWTA